MALINNSTISFNKATEAGGGLWIYNAGSSAQVQAELRNSTISNNTSAGDGGGVWVGISQANHSVAFNCINSTITNNLAEGDRGGGVFLQTHPGLVVTKDIGAGSLVIICGALGRHHFVKCST